MASLTPVDDDPFAAPAGLTPVDHDPFATAPANPKAYVPGQIAGYQVPGLATLEGAGQAAADTGTYGLADTIVGGIHKLTGAGPTGDQARADTQAQTANLNPFVRAGMDVLGYAAGGGAAGIGESLARLLGRGIGGRMAAGAVEGGGSTLAGSLGHGETDPDKLGKDAIVGTLTGGLVGGLPSVKATPNTPSTADKMNDAYNAWQKTYGVSVNPSDVSAAIVKAHLGLTPGERTLMAGPTDSVINKVLRESQGHNSLSGNDLKKFQDAIMGSTRDPTALHVAGKFKDSLDNAYGPQAQPTVTAANRATNVAKTSDEIDQWLANPKGAPAAVGKALADNPGYYRGVTSALQPIAGMANQTLGQEIKSRLATAAVGAGLGYGASTLTGGNPTGETITGAVLGALKGRGTAALRNAPISRGLLAAKHLNATGVNLPPSAFSQSGPMTTAPSDLLKKFIYSQGAAGRGY